MGLYKFAAANWRPWARKSVFVILFAGMWFIPVRGLGQQEAAQAHLVDHKPLMNTVWDAFNTLMYKVTKKDGQTLYTPHFPESLNRLNGKRVVLRGYMIPIGHGRRHDVFLLSVLPIHQCMFCGQNGIPPMAEVTLSGNKRILFTEDPITIRGTVYLNATDEKRTEIQLREATADLAGN